MREPKEAVRQALTKAARGTTSGSWMSHDPRPGLVSLHVIHQSATGAELYDIMLDAVERGQEDAHNAAHTARASILYDLERIASETDSHMLHTYAERLRADLYPKEKK